MSGGEDAVFFSTWGKGILSDWIKSIYPSFCTAASLSSSIKEQERKSVFSSKEKGEGFSNDSESGEQDLKWYSLSLPERVC